MGRVDVGRRLPLTWDQGSEMSGHDLIARLFSEGVFFANPGSS
jgi:IS30 family transposase